MGWEVKRSQRLPAPPSADLHLVVWVRPDFPSAPDCGRGCYGLELVGSPVFIEKAGDIEWLQMGCTFLLGVQYINSTGGSKLGFSELWGSPWGNLCLSVSSFKGDWGRPVVTQ